MVMGRPKIYNNCLDLDGKAELYFESCLYEDEGCYIERKTPIHLTITGLAIALGMDRQSIINYSKDGDFFATIKRHRTIVENYLEQKLYGNNVTGLIFNLKNNFEWKDKTEQDINARVSAGGKWTIEEVKANPPSENKEDKKEK